MANHDCALALGSKQRTFLAQFLFFMHPNARGEYPRLTKVANHLQRCGKRYFVVPTT